MIPTEHLLLGVAMALTTYLIRMLPMTLFRWEIKTRFAKRFFHYIPYAVLAAMLIPAVFSSTGTLITAVAGIAVGLALSFFNQSLIVVALASALTAYLVSFLVF